jgi:hypothetical protein
MDQQQYLQYIPVFIWTLVWKGLGLWKASKKGNKVVFVIFLVINTLGALEILYIVWLSKIDSVKLVKQIKTRFPALLPIAKKLRIKI